MVFFGSPLAAVWGVRTQGTCRDTGFAFEDVLPGMVKTLSTRAKWIFFSRCRGAFGEDALSVERYDGHSYSHFFSSIMAVNKHLCVCECARMLFEKFKLLNV